MDGSVVGVDGLQGFSWTRRSARVDLGGDLGCWSVYLALELLGSMASVISYNVYRLCSGESSFNIANIFLTASNSVCLFASDGCIVLSVYEHVDWRSCIPMSHSFVPSIQVVRRPTRVDGPSVVAIPLSPASRNRAP
ncbi:hypothetical protein KC347_g223 [Hortaea werneckii]|nr:hypothetical protein KC347_g223 [Hortaea werneckii]